MIVFILIWASGCAGIVAAELLSTILHYDFERPRWWFIHTLVAAIVWPLILLAIIVVGFYNTLKMKIELL